VLVVPGDAPLLTGATLAEFVAQHRARGAAASLLTATIDDPAGYGRIVRDAGGMVARIVEAYEAAEKLNPPAERRNLDPAPAPTTRRHTRPPSHASSTAA
jgi:bifunctional N-acetylglucosamine-1-phosphate-uridyltransferase/glucosamine-1-phosphate-acetyltransferase GlmU-like protein